MAQVVNVIIDGKKAKQKIKKLNNLGPVYAKLLYESADYARKIAKREVPVGQTGKTKSTIISVIKVKDKNFGEARVGHERNPHPERRWLGSEFNLPAWMFYSRKALTHFNSGHPRYLKIAAGMTKTKFGKDVRAKTGALIKG